MNPIKEGELTALQKPEVKLIILVTIPTFLVCPEVMSLDSF